MATHLFTLIAWIVSALVFLPIVLTGVFGGIKRGLLHSLVKLGALILSVALSVVIVLLLRSPLNALTDLLISYLVPALPAGELYTAVLQLPTSVLLLVAFLPVFAVVRLLMLIPQKLLTKKLPRLCKESVAVKATASEQLTAAAAPAGEAGDGIAASTDVDFRVTADDSAVETVTPFDVTVQAGTQKQPFPWNALLWKMGGAVCGVLSGILFWGALLMPLSCSVVRIGGAASAVLNAVEQQEDGKSNVPSVVVEGIDAVAHAPLFTVTDFFYGVPVYETLTSFTVDSVRVNPSHELEVVTDAFCEGLPSILRLSNNETLTDRDVDALESAASHLKKSDYVMLLGAATTNLYADELEKKAADESLTRGERELMTAFAELLDSTDRNTLRSDLSTFVDLVDAAQDSSVLTLISQPESLSPADIAEDAFFSDAFGILYDNQHTQELLIPMVNLCSETIFIGMNAEPIYSEATIDQFTRSQIVAEAQLLSAVAADTVTFSTSVSESEDFAQYELTVAGKALDNMRSSMLFGAQYEVIVRNVVSTTSSDTSQSLTESLGDALIECESAEKLMNSAEGLVTMSDQLKHSELKGSNNPELVGALDTLLNNTSEKDCDTLADIAGDEYFSDGVDVDAETQNQMVQDFMRSIAVVGKKGCENVEAEADAVQMMQDLSKAEAGKAFVEIKEAEMVDALLNSMIAEDMLKTLNAENRNYGIPEKLTEENKQNIQSALDDAEADEARKAQISTFFGLE